MQKIWLYFGREASRLALLGAAMAGSSYGVAVAQDQPATAPSAAPMEEIVVTGSRIRTSDVTAAEPLTVLSSTQINETKAINLEQFMQKIPSIDFNAFSPNNNNGGLGASEAAIHFLGNQRTLVLINGYRFVGTDTQTNFAAVDLNNIPLPMIDHVEVLRDGASSIYGADALAGVINVITKKNFVGFQVDAGYGITDKSDGQQYDTSALLGVGSDRANLMLDVSYDHQDPINQIDRDWASKQYRANNSPTGALIGATSGRPPGLRLIDPNTGAGKYFGGIHDNLVLQPGFRFDITKEPFLIGEAERKQVNATGHYDITDNITAILEGFYTNRTSHERLNPEPIDFLTTTIKYPNGFILPFCLFGDPTCASGVNPNAVRAGVTSDQLARTRRFEGGPREYTDSIDTYRLRIGLEGKVLDNYNWEVGYVYGRSEAQYRVAGEANFTHFFQLAGAVPCGVDAASGCHVANIVGDNTLTPQEIGYMQFVNTRTSEVAQDFTYGNITGPFPYVPELQGGPAKFAAGFEYRNESTFDNPDSVIVNGDGNSNAAPTHGSYNVAAGYVEFDAPLFKDLPWVKALTLKGSMRYDYYSVFGAATTWSANADYAPTEDIRFRVTRSTGFRAPSIKELFGGAFQNFEPSTDPCDTSGAGASPGSPNCVKALGARAATFVTTQTQTTTINQGTPSLKPENSQNWDLGVVITPRWVPGYSLEVDYWNVFIRNQIIDGIGAQTLMNDCYFPTIMSATACATITRSSTSGEVTSINAPNLNFGFEHTQGIDVDMNYVFNVSEIGIDRPGSLAINGSAQYLLHDELFQAPGTVPFDAAGTWQIVGGSEFGEPRWKALLNLNYSEGNWSLGFTERYTGGVTLLQGVPHALGNNAPGVFYTDLSFTYNYTDATFIVGIDNLLDKVPPFLNDAATNSITNGGYDYVGRFLYLKVTWKF